jgi:hypothetical protein
VTGDPRQAALSELPDDELLATLTAIPGIGPWAVQRATLIPLRREHVVLAGDLALRKAAQAAYQLSHLPTEQEVLTLADKWRPYRVRRPVPVLAAGVPCDRAGRAATRRERAVRVSCPGRIHPNRVTAAHSVRAHSADERHGTEETMNDVLDTVLNAHGGLGRWSEASPSTATPDAGGPFWKLGIPSAQPLAQRANQRPRRAAFAADP